MYGGYKLPNDKYEIICASLGEACLNKEAKTSVIFNLEDSDSNYSNIYATSLKLNDSILDNFFSEFFDV